LLCTKHKIKFFINFLYLLFEIGKLMNTQTNPEVEPSNPFQSMRDRIQSLHNFRSEPVLGEANNIKDFMKPLAVITLDIGEKTEIVKIFEGEDIKKKAIEITKKHNLTEEAVDYLIENINLQIKSSLNEKNSVNHYLKNSIDTTTDLNLVNKSLAEIQYENWQKILQQKTKLKHDHARNTNPSKPHEMNSYASTPNMNYHLNNSKISDDRNASIYEKLYQAAVYSQNKKKENSRIFIETKEKKDNFESTFKPQINSKFKPKSSKNTSVSPIRRPQDVSDYLYNDGKKYMERKKKTEKIKEEMELEKCPFKPNINKTSHILNENQSNKSPYKNIHEKLYKGGMEEEHKKEMWRKKNFNLYYPFQPNLFKEEKNVSMMKKEEYDEFINRLVNSKKIKEQNYTNVKIQDLGDIDKKTGQALFQPIITKDQYYYNVKSKENDEYEELRREIKENLKVKGKNVKKEKMNKTDNNIKHEKNVNVEIKEDDMTKLLRGIFKSMDDDKDKLISSKNIDLSEIDPYFLEIIQEILYEMEEKKQKLDFKTFFSRIKEYGFEKKIYEVFI